MTNTKNATIPAIGLLALLVPAQEPLDLLEFAAIPAVTGNEQHLLRRIAATIPRGWKTRVDAFGTMVVTSEEAEPTRLLIAVGVDEPGYVVSQIRDDGYLRLRTLGSPRNAAAFHGNNEGRPVRIATRGGEVPGVTVVNSLHLRSPRPATIGEADLWVDVGADSSAQVAELGIELLDPVAAREPVAFGNRFVAAPDMGKRALVWLLLQTIRSLDPGDVHSDLAFAFTAQSTIRGGPGGRGLAAAINTLQPASVLLLRSRTRGENGVTGPSPVRMAGAGTAAVLELGMTHPGTPVETVAVEDMEALLTKLDEQFGIHRLVAHEIDLENQLWDVPEHPRTEHSAAASTLRRLVHARGVSGREDEVREALIAELARIDPDWKPIVDNAGNLLLTLGEGERTIAFIAHMDEVGLAVTGIRDDGLLETRTQGGIMAQLYRNTAMELKTRTGILPCIAVAGAGQGNRIETLIDVGARSPAEAEAMGIAIEDRATVPKECVRLGQRRAAGRSFDDRVGCAAQILALAKIARTSLDRRVVFAWVTEEETGLRGARFLASQMDPKPETVFAVDTFVSSDSPRDDYRFAYTPIGAGPVLRAVDTSSITPRPALARVRELASAANIPLQTGIVSGGNDGSVFVAQDIVNCPISWPQRCSHSRVETMDLRDLERLADLIALLAIDY